MTVLLANVRSVCGQLVRLCCQPALATTLATALLSSLAMGQASELTAESPEQSALAKVLAAREAERVERLRGLLAAYHQEEQESARFLPSAREIARREAAQKDAQKRTKIPFSSDQVRLNGSQGSAALIQITQRLTDPTIAESPRDVAPTCSIETYLFGSLVGGESYSLQSVGKNHFIARVRLQPGTTTLRILEQNWEVKRPENASASNFLITLYSPPGSKPELHLFAVDELLAEKDAHIPAWLPEELKIKTLAG